MAYDVSKLKFDISITYDCDEGEGCDRYLENGTYKEAIALFEDLESRPWIDRYYHYMSIDKFDVYDENGNELDLDKILDNEYSWICGYCSLASEIPAACLEFLEDLKDGDKKRNAKKAKTLKKRIKELEKELDTSKAELAKLMKSGKKG